MRRRNHRVVQAKTVDLVYFNAGGGHRAAALALQETMRREHRPWEVRLVDLTAVLDPKNAFRRLTGLAPEDLYNLRLERGWTRGMAQELRLLQGLIRLTHATLTRTLERHWAATQPDLVVSLVPNFNRALYQSVRAARPGVPYVTVMTDMADLPPHFWIEPGQDQHLVCGTAHAAAQARAAGYPESQVHLTSGMVLRPDFYSTDGSDPVERRRELGLDPQAPTGLVLFGGHGSMKMLHIARALGDVQLILVCGHNKALMRRLAQRNDAAPRAVLGFRSDLPQLMRAADFFIGKPGPASISEAVQMGLPVITFDHAGTMPQERWNLQWLRDNRLGLSVSQLKQLPQAARTVMADLANYRAAAARVNNRAVFEVPQILAGLLELGPASAALAQRPAQGTALPLPPNPRIDLGAWT